MSGRSAFATFPHARDRARFEAYLAEILTALGLDLSAPAAAGTPGRLLDALIDSTSGYAPDPKLVTVFPARDREGAQVVEVAIPFTALCEHHALPFFGHACVGYLPAAHVVGLSKLTRLVHQHARRFTMQERLAEDVANSLHELAEVRGAAVRIDAVHLCTRMRGVRDTEAITRSLYWSGEYRDSPALRAEFLDLCSR